MFRFRAIRKSCPEVSRWYHFKIEEGPAILWDDSFFLCGKENTPVMLLNTIVRGHPTLNLFEGDYVYSSNDDKFLGLVIYDNGFFMQKSSEAFKKTIPHGHIYVKRGDYASICSLAKFKRTPILFRYDTTEFSIIDIVSVSGGIMSLILRTHHQKVNISGVRALIYQNDTTHENGYEGDIFDGNLLTIESVNIVSGESQYYEGDVQK